MNIIRYMFRGGSWMVGARGIRDAYRLAYRPGGRGNDLGFRLAQVQNMEEAK